MTTPDPVRLQRAFRQYVDQGLGACAIEASSIGLAEARLDGTLIRTAIFTNFTQDHLDYHGSMADYWLAKRALFDWTGLQAAVINVDDPAGVQLHSELSGRALDLWSISAHGPARLAARDIALGDQGLRFTVVEGAEQQTLQTRVIGHYNVLNLLGVLATLRSQGGSQIWWRGLDGTARLDGKDLFLGGIKLDDYLEQSLSQPAKKLTTAELTSALQGGDTAINQLALAGVGIVVISSELPEIIGTCDRVLIMREGQLVAEVGGASGQAISQERIIDLATGGDQVVANG